MSSFSDTMEIDILDHVHGNTAFTQPAGQFLALFTTAPTDAGGGVEVSGGGYARQSTSFGAAAAGAISNDVAVAFTASGAAFGTVLAVGLFSAVTAGDFLWWDTITSAVVNDGDTINFAIGAIDVTLD